jgi:predicted SAM-dependent methyltransferase
MTQKRLHIGSGKVYLPGWTNVDLFSNAKADLYCDMMRLPFEKESFDLIYACHVLEHAHRHTVYAVLHHWRELLKPEGILRLAVPSFDAIIQRYKDTGDLAELMGLLYGGQNHPLNVHAVAFDDTSLRAALEKVGFKEIRYWDWRQTDHSQFDDYSQCRLPHMAPDDLQTRKMGYVIWMSLNMEAAK